MSIRQRVVRQFHRPTGLAGRLVGRVMAHRSSNRQRNEWVVSLLDVRPADRVLEVGFGPGIAIHELSRRAAAGRVYGVDHSDVMVRQATRRNAAAVRAGRVDLRLAAVDALPDFGDPLDKVLAVNSAQFWPEPVERLRDLRGRLRPGGLIAIATQPRCPGATEATSREAAASIEKLLVDAGFSSTHVETLDLTPPVACVVAINDVSVPVRHPTAGRAAGA